MGAAWRISQRRAGRRAGRQARRQAYNGGMPEAAPPAAPHLRRLWEIAREVVAGTERLTAGLSAAQLAWQPAPERWSVAQCFAHLVVTGDAYYPRVQAAIEAARARGLRQRRPF